MNLILEKINKTLVDYFTLTPYLVSQQQAEQSIREGVSFRGTNMIILILAIFIASLGLNTNSTAVIIGAMLISPLMGPIIGIGLGVGIQDFELLKRSGRNLMMAAAFSVATSTIYFLISPVGEGHSELLARTSPTIYDVLIGFFGGGAGIVAIGSKSKGNVIPGVAIATALMPPLCTVGYGLATWQMQYFFGALYLFIINSIFIGLATFIGVKLMKYKLAPTTDPGRARRVRRLVFAVALLTILPSIYLTYNMIRQNRFEMSTQRFVAEECVFPDTHVLSSKPSWSRNHRSLTITLIGQPLPQDSLLPALENQLRFYGLQGTVLNIVQGNQLTASDSQGTTLRELFQLSQSRLDQKQNEIDSLKSVISSVNRADSAASSLLPGVKVIFPQVTALAITRPMAIGTDTIPMAIVSTSAPLPRQQKEKLQAYLRATLRAPELRILDL